MDNTMDYFDEVWKIFSQSTQSLEFQVIDLSATTGTELNVLAMPFKDARPHSYLYTASFFCRKKTDWFIYRIILPTENQILEPEKADIYKRLEIHARFTMDSRKRTKNPFKYLGEGFQI